MVRKLFFVCRIVTSIYWFHMNGVSDFAIMTVDLLVVDVHFNFCAVRECCHSMVEISVIAEYLDVFAGYPLTRNSVADNFF